MVDASIVRIVQDYLRRVHTSGLAVRFGVIFGSWATGKDHQWSDIDLVVVSPAFDGGCRRSDIDLLWRLAASSDSRIEPIPCGERQWLEDDTSAIIEIARREGERVILPIAEISSQR
ncbi:MAG: nucleotidyltransferase domain-containing protein [Chloroflexi bacterium]|nr:nucleotidyltransferase domain-containing protein [Chloroflexota bacterium]MBI3732110.1 nucleotidyltransferase domain-containing protein [Chloroflexota bacterium]